MRFRINWNKNSLNEMDRTVNNLDTFIMKKIQVKYGLEWNASNIVT